MRSHNSSPASRAHDAPRAPSRAAFAPAHFAPMAAPRSIGDTGRLPDGPRRTSNVVPTPIATPISAAVSKSYCSSATGSRSSRSFAFTRSAHVLPPSVPTLESRPRDIVLGRRGVAVVAIAPLLLGIDLAVQLELIEIFVVSCRKLRPITHSRQRRSAGSYAANCRRGRHEHALRLFLDHTQQGVEIAQPPFRDRHRLLQPLISIRDRRVDALHVRSDG